MNDENKKPAADEENAGRELDLDDLKQVTGGSIEKVKYQPTVDISSDTKSKI